MANKNAPKREKKKSKKDDGKAPFLRSVSTDPPVGVVQKRKAAKERME
ncbi:MAG: hypothetical protein J4F46_04510 [Dehalococcoidia bacterium]|nr:hypothetical protein [Dehalococcoidia bacterium]